MLLVIPLINSARIPDPIFTERTCWTNAYRIRIYGEFTCRSQPYNPQVSLIEHKGAHNGKLLIDKIKFLNGRKGTSNKILYNGRFNVTKIGEDFSVSVEVKHQCSRLRYDDSCSYSFGFNIPKSYIDCHGNEEAFLNFETIELTDPQFQKGESCIDFMIMI
uniref:DUF4377 domain-containing protein n=1 Tax=Parastrongyloides trichosuri TaxID=131310 RepID=A0A0N5A037_PARTI